MAAAAESMIVYPELARARFESDLERLLTAPDILAKVGRRIVRCSYPVLEVELDWLATGAPIILHVEAIDYDYRPVRGWWVDTLGQPIVGGARLVPVNNGFQQNPNPYNEPRAWFCFRGWREYHDHQSHQELSWASLRREEQYRLPGLIAQLHSDLNHSDPSRRPVPQ